MAASVIDLTSASETLVIDLTRDRSPPPASAPSVCLIPDLKPHTDQVSRVGFDHFLDPRANRSGRFFPHLLFVDAQFLGPTVLTPTVLTPRIIQLNHTHFV